MTRQHRTAPIFAVLACVLGCSSASDAEAELRPRVEASLPPVPEPAAEAEAEAEAAAEGAAALEPIPETVIEIAGSEANTSEKVLAVSAPEPTPAQLSWREVADFDEPLRFVYFASGALARTDTGYYELDERGGLSPSRPELGLPSDPLEGRWPSDVWYLRSTPVEVKGKREPELEHRPMHLDESGEWVPGKHRRRSEWIGVELAVHKSWRGGVLVREQALLTPVGARGNPMKIGPRMGKKVIEVFESRAGDLYTVSARSAGYYVQGKCADFDCVEANARKLPYGTRWSFGIQVPRHHHGLSILARVEIEGVTAHHLLHCGINGWTLESLLHPGKGLWATAEGGLWMILNDELWYRDDGGSWHTVDLPKGAEAISAAMVGEDEELWIAAKVGERGVVFATSGSLDEP